MTKKVRVSLPDCDYERNEDLEEAIIIIGEYFYKASSHFMFRKLEDIPENSIHFFPQVETHLFVEKTVKVFYAKEVPCVFYDMRWKITETETADAAEKAIKLMLNNTTIGYYLIDKNILLSTDWTHDEECVDVLAEIWQELVENLNLKKLKRRNRKKISITLGCDPEFELIEGGYVRCADGVIADRDYHNQIGLDGSGNQVEFRPKPSDSPEGLIKEIKNLIAYFDSKYPEYDLSAEGHYYPLGGHIHLGGVKPCREIIKVLDDFLGEKVINLSGRARGEYKRLGAYEIKRYGFEYRTPPSAIFAQSKIAEICLKIAKNTIEELVNNGEVSYNLPPTAEDYKKIAKLTDDEIKTFIEFLEKKSTPKSLLAAWGFERPLLRVKFNDEWSIDVETKIKKFLMRELKNENITLTLYGLKRERGEVSTIPVPGFDILTDPPHPAVKNGELWIGLPYSFRKGLEDDIDIAVEWVGTSIVSYVRRYLHENKMD